MVEAKLHLKNEELNPAPGTGLSNNAWDKNVGSANFGEEKEEV